MQPPPRKGNYVKFLRNLHAEQVAKLQLKNQHECDLLEDIRQFTVKRSAIEKTYSEALLKISSQYLNKKIPNIPDIKMEGMEERWNMWSVWRTVLEENEKLARARLAAIEVFQQQIADEAKVLRDYKVGIAKKSLAHIVNVQKELHLSVADLDKMKKQYFDEEHCAHDVRDKARDIEEKLKKKKGSFFQSITSLQKNSARVTSRKELLEEKSTGARNDYILSLAATNAHQNRYFTVDLQTTMTTMENYVFERVAEYLTLMGRTELLTCSATQNSFGKIRDQAQQLTREYNLQCCYLFYPVLKQHIQYEFEPCDNDPVRKVTTEHESAVETLTKEARNLASRVVKENVSVRENAKKLAICVALRDSGQRTDPNDPNGPDLDTKIEELRDMIRRSETEKAKAEACLQCLREGGINVDEWVQEAEIIGAQELTRSASSISMRTDASGQGENPSSDSFYDSDKEDTGTTDNQAITRKPYEENKLTHVKTFSDSEEEEPAAEAAPASSNVPMMVPMTGATGWDDPTKINWGEEEEEAEVERDDVSMAPELKEVIFKCTALYSYSAQNPDELTIVENEQLEVIGEGDGDGWLRARNYRGEVGYVPHNYLDIEQDANINGATANVLRSQISFSSVDYTVDNEDQTGDSMQSPDQVSVIMAPATTTITTTTLMGSCSITGADTTTATAQKTPHTSDVQYCIAMYDYDATAEDELTFEEGQIIKIITKTAHGVDDGWWEGELNGKFGNFPSLVVEECDENGEPFSEGDDISLPTSTLPSIALPPVPTLPPEYAHELNDDMFGSQDTVDDDSGYIPNGSVQNITASVLTQEAGPENPNESTDVKDAISEQKPLVTVTHPALKIKSESSKHQGSGDTSHLGMAQIVVTAATPMFEDGKAKSFPLTDDTNNSNKEEKQTNKKQIEQVVSKTNNKGGKKGDEVRSLPTKVSTIETHNNHVEGRQDNEVCVTVTLTSASPISDDIEQSSTLSEQDSDIACVQPLKEAEDPFNEKKSTEISSTEIKTNNAIPFEANFEDAFAENAFNNATENILKNGGEEDEATPKQVVGGRASIPEELDSNQLARLQNLKESNA